MPTNGSNHTDRSRTSTVTLLLVPWLHNILRRVWSKVGDIVVYFLLGAQ